ncbi:hypothetical protein P3X46_034507, partial [Hevea brasiliensis]
VRMEDKFVGQLVMLAKPTLKDQNGNFTSPIDMPPIRDENRHKRTQFSSRNHGQKLTKT